MSVSTTTAEAIFNGNGVTTIFSLGYEVRFAAELRVWLREGAVDTLQVFGVDYTVQNLGVETGAQVIMVTAPAVGQRLVTARDTGLTQEVQLNALRRLDGEAALDALDQLTMAAQEIKATLERALRFPVGQPVQEIIFGGSSGYLFYNELGELQVVPADFGELPAIIPVSNGGTGGTTIEEGQAGLELVPGVDVQPYDPVLDDLTGAGTVVRPFVDEVWVEGPVPRTVLKETTGAISGAELVDTRINNGTYRVGARSLADTAVATFMETVFTAAGASEHRFFVGPTQRLIVDSLGVQVNDVLRTGRLSWTNPVATISDIDPIQDCDDIVSSGLYYATQSALNKPPIPATQAVYLNHMRQFSDDWWQQLALRDAASQSTLFIRGQQNAAPGVWRRIEGYEQTSQFATPSGTQVEFTALPQDLTSFRLLFDGVAVNGSGDLIDVLLRTTPGGPITTGYVGSTNVTRDALATVGYGITTAIRLGVGTSGILRGGEIAFRRIGDGSVWEWAGTVAGSVNNRVNLTAGRVTGLANPVSGIRLTAVTGAFAGGGFYVEWGG